jgi:hypothetical protein
MDTTTTTTTPAGRRPAYPLRRPASNDQRFTLGLVMDISQVLVAHGYPPMATGADLLRWQNALFDIIYHPSRYYRGNQHNQTKETA